MDALMYFKEKKRLAKDCEIVCSDCRLGATLNGKDYGCSSLEDEYPEQAVAIIEQWSKDCPEETYRSHFLKSYPKANFNFCQRFVFGGAEPCLSEMSCADCWDQPYKEEN